MDYTSSQKKDSFRNRFKLKKGNEIAAFIIVIIVLFMICLVLFRESVRIGANALRDNYNVTYVQEKESSHGKVYNAFFEAAEKKYHVKNSVAIEIGNLKEEQKLEVLKVSDVEYIIEEAESNDQNIVSWLEVPGEATFIVDLKAGEFIVDKERAHVTIRVPYPELANVKIDYGNVNKLMFKDDLFNGSYSTGEELARQQLGEAELLIKKEFTSNQNYYLNAQKAAISTIENLVKQLNPNVPDLVVEVEFY